MNPANLFQLKNTIDVLKMNHPKVPLFLKAACKNALKEGSVIEVTITTPEGKKMCTNAKLKDSDVKAINSLLE